MNLQDRIVKLLYELEALTHDRIEEAYDEGYDDGHYDGYEEGYEDAEDDIIHD